MFTEWIAAFRCLLLCIGLLAALPVEAADAIIPLAGTWRFALDPQDAGIGEHWFERSLAQEIKLPGALQNQGYGEEITVATKWTGDVGSERWRQRPEYEQYRQPGNLKLPFFLQPEKHYVGPAWYQRDFDLPKSWQGQRVVLSLERPHWETRVWLNRRFIGSNDSLGTPHAYDLGALAPGKHRLTVRVDNRLLVGVGDWSHSVSDHTQGNWNGIVGALQLEATAPVWVEDLQVFPEAARKRVRASVTMGNALGQTATARLRFGLRSPGPATAPAFPPRDRDIPIPEGLTRVELDYPVEAPALWDEFDPRLFSFEVQGEAAGADGGRAGAAQGRAMLHHRSAVFGFREIGTTPDRQFLLNGRPAFFRGTLECCIFPLTGYPPTDVSAWKRLLGIARAHGLNHLRFHSWCPPEAAFVAADELGFYYQIECGVWTQPGNGQPIDAWIYRESERIVRAYGNHPSFVLFTHGNEPHGPKREEYLAGWVNHWKAKDPRRLYTSGSAYPQLPENQYHVHHTGRGPSGWLGKDYRKPYAAYGVPIIIHEMGQWCVYPNFDEVKKYTGPLKPKNFDIFRDSLAAHGMLAQAKDFLQASGKLQALCYKEECEAALRTPGVGGVQLLDLHDFPGQGTALVGVLDPFWDSKGYISAAEFRRFYNPTVPLARLLKRTWTTAETLTAAVEVAHYGPAPIANAAATWKLSDPAGRPAARGAFPSRTIPLGQGTPLGTLSLPLEKLAAPMVYKLTVQVGPGSPESRPRGDAPVPVENDWNVWLYPAAAEGRPEAGVLVTRALDAAALAALESGGRVLLASAKLSAVHPRLGFEPIFWNRYMFHTQGRQTLGLLCNPQHPALARFPTEAWQDWQWHDVVTQARGVILDDLPQALRPVVQVIDDWNTNRKLGLVFEGRLGPGRLLVCAADLESSLDQRPAARQLRDSLLAYAASDQFRPAISLRPEDLVRVLHRAAKSTLVNLGARVVKADSEDRAHGNVAANAADGDPDTFWHTRWQPANDPLPHELILDLGREIVLKGLTYLPRQDQANGRIAACEIFCSTDLQSWPPPIARPKWTNGSGLQTVQFPAPVSARYLKLRATAEVNQQPFTAIAELDVLTESK